MYNILQRHGELGPGPHEHGLGSRALYQGPLNFKERNSFLPSNWSFRPFLAKSAHMQLLANSGEEKCKSFRPRPSGFLAWATGGLVGTCVPALWTQLGNTRLELSQAAGSCANSKGAKVRVTGRTGSMGQTFAHLKIRKYPQMRGRACGAYSVRKLTKALG